MEFLWALLKCHTFWTTMWGAGTYGPISIQLAFIRRTFQLSSTLGYWII